MESTQPFNSDTTEKPSKNPFKNMPRRYVGLGFGVLVVIVVAVVLVAALGGKNSNSKQQGSSDMYYSRPGFAKIPSVGDPAAISMSAGAGRPVEQNSAKIVQACNVLSVKDVRDAGLQLSPNALVGPLQRAYFDGQSSATLPKSDLTLPTNEEGNTCMYQLNNPNKQVRINIFQLPIVSNSAINYELGKYKKTGRLENLNVYKRTSGSFAYYMLRSSDVAMQVVMEVHDQEVADKLLQTAAANFVQQKKNPTGVPVVSYDSPLMKNYAKACDLIKADDIHEYFGAAASPLVREQAASAIGVIEFTRKDNSKFQANYIANDCYRQPAVVASMFGSAVQSLHVQATTYKTDEGAREQMNFLRGFNKNVAEAPGIGNEAFTSVDSNGAKTLDLRKGSIVVELTVSDTSHKIDIARTLSDFGKREANRL